MKSVLSLVFVTLFGLPLRTLAQAESDTAAIQRLRAASNEAIRQHDSARVASFLTDDVHVTAGSGATLDGKATVAARFESQFKKHPALVYVRTPDRITPSTAAPLAAEHGAWIGRWQEDGKHVEASGEYLAMWRKTGQGWLIRSELFVTLERREDGALVPAK